ncbi:MAG: hypothetical protein ACYDGR_12815 [Candidatus Dormibacteria bacterium]
MIEAGHQLTDIEVRPAGREWVLVRGEHMVRDGFANSSQAFEWAEEALDLPGFWRLLPSGHYAALT